MALILQQQPLFNILPVGQQVIFTVLDGTAVANYFNVKYIAQLHVSDTPINLSNNNDLVGTYKSVPNNAGAGIFDFRAVLESFVSPDNLGSTYGNGSRYKQAIATPVGDVVAHPIHVIDKIAVSENSIKYFAINFFVQYSFTASGLSIEFDSLAPEPTDLYIMFNGVLQYDDVLTLTNGNYGYNMTDNFLLYAAVDQILSNAPRDQNARITDYGTFPFLNNMSGIVVTSVTITYYPEDGGSLGAETIDIDYANGGAYANGDINGRLMYIGIYPANLRNWSTLFQSIVLLGTLDHYEIKFNNNTGASVKPYRIYIQCPNEKGYEGIRLTWLNQWGTWDYYTFNMKSTRTVKTKKTSYSQLPGTWNQSLFKISDYKGGKKSFRVNSTEKIKLNTDFVSEAESLWFEELISSTEVYIVNGFSDGDDTETMTNKYIIPVTLTTSSYVKKTIANDKLMQYTFEIEKSRMVRTQSV